LFFLANLEGRKMQRKMNSYNFFLIFLFYFFLEIFEGFFFIQNAQSGVCPDQVIAHPHLVGPATTGPVFR